jgi:hypothetical protein
LNAVGLPRASTEKPVLVATAVIAYPITLANYAQNSAHGACMACWNASFAAISALPGAIMV